MNFGMWVHSKLKMVGVTQKFFCKKFGVHQATLANWKNGVHAPGVMLAMEIVDYLAVLLQEDAEDLWIELRRKVG